MIKVLVKLFPLKLRDSFRFLKHPYQTFLRFVLKKQSKLKIMQGPFQGMKFDVPDFNTAMLVGTWELELVECVDQLNCIAPSAIICIGAAEGYYAIGMAIRFPDLKVIAYEEQEKYLKFLTDLAESNGVNNVIPRGKCAPADIENTINESGLKPLIICDVEGFEIELLDPQISPGLKSAYILVELHDMYVTRCEETLLDRFEKSHTSKIIYGRNRLVSDLPERLRFLRFFSTTSTLVNLMNEGRPYPMKWLWLKPKNKI
jgi:hypothetical protein